MKKVLFTSESVTEGHPDKICDKISDAILDEILSQDPESRVACETFATTGIITVMGEITTKAKIDYQKIVRDTVAEIGYDRAKYGFDATTCAVLSSIHEQSADIALGVANMVAETVAMMSVFAARGHGIRDVVIIGNLTNIGAVRSVFENLGSFGINFIIPENSSFGTVIGAALYDSLEG